ncbi:MAG: SEL1-like repeat protein, partial [Synergistaceae bacterium]|nr:SEL1-like repeat protein [Synergistaceae bacterium]
MKKCFVVVLALMLLAFASVSMAVENLPQSEVDEIVKGVERGDAEARFRLGMMYYNGQNVKRDYEQAFYWFKKSYEQGNVEAQFLLAISYAIGYGVEKDKAQAFKLMKQIAEKAPSSIKKVYGVEGLYSSAEELIAAAQCGVGDLYYNGRGVQKDNEQAEYWLNKSLEHGNENIKKEAKKYLEKIRAEKAKQSQTSIASTQQSNSDNVIEIEIEQAFKECRDNGLVYKRKYSGKKVRVSGKIFEIDTYPFSEKIFIRLSYKEIDDLDDDLYCFFEDSEADSVMKFKVGQKVTIEGTCIIRQSPFSLEKCRIVNAPQAQPQTSTSNSQVSAPSAITENTPSQTNEAPVYERPHYKMSDAEYKQFMKNPDFAKADKALNNAWKNAKKRLSANEFDTLKREQKEWISSGRDDEASDLINNHLLSKIEAYTTVTHARANYIAQLSKGNDIVAAIVLGDKVNVRSKPNTKSKVLFQVNRYLNGEEERLIV